MGALQGTRILVAVAVAAGLSATLTGVSNAVAALPTLSVPAAVSVVEGNAGTSNLVVPATLSAPAPTAVTVAYTTIDGTAKVGTGDYVATTGTLTIPAGATTRSITVAINGDLTREDFELFSFRLSLPTGATFGTAIARVTVENDEAPLLIMATATSVEGQPIRYRPRLAQRYYRTMDVTAATVNGTAYSPGDYTAANRVVTFPAGSTGPVDVLVTTNNDGLVEPAEWLSLNVSGGGAANAVTAKATITDAPACAGGTVPNAPTRYAPASPSSAAGWPPPEVLGIRPWDLVFNDEFDSATVTASKWSTGMRDGARTLEGNRELQWYLPANSTVTTDTDGIAPVTVLQQRLQAGTVANNFYTVRTLSRLYPPALCPHLYDPARLAANDKTLVPFRFTSGMLNSAKSFGFRYGYVEARVKMPRGFALWPALWMRNWGPWSREIDVMEGFDREARLVRSTYWWGSGSHFGTNNNGGDLGVLGAGSCRGLTPLPVLTTVPSQCSLSTAVDLSAGYHTVGLHWTATSYRVYVDGVRRWESAPGAVVDNAYNHLILNLALGNSTDEFDWADEPVRPLDANVLATPWFPKPTVEWDYVRVWQLADERAVCTTGTC